MPSASLNTEVTTIRVSETVYGSQSLNLLKIMKHLTGQNVETFNK